MSCLVSRVKSIKEETHNLMSLRDVENLVINTMGEDIWNAIMYFVEEDAEEKEYEGPNIITYVEDGIFSQQVEESGVIEKVVKMVIADLEGQGFIKKSKDIDKFNYEDIYYREVIDEILTPGMMNYFEK